MVKIMSGGVHLGPSVSYRGHRDDWSLCTDTDKSLARPTSRFILFDDENISFDASFVISI